MTGTHTFSTADGEAAFITAPSAMRPAAPRSTLRRVPGEHGARAQIAWAEEALALLADADGNDHR